MTLQLMGRVERGALLTRGGGNVGDDVYVTGTLGDSAAGIALITERVDGAPGLGRRGAQGTLLSAGAARRARARAALARERRDRRLRRIARRLRAHLRARAAAAR